MIPEEMLAKARRLLSEAKRPIFLHDDDTDGTASFILCYQFCEGNGKGIPVKRGPTVGHEFARYVQEFDADAIIILDKPKVDVAFLEEFSIPILWLDHHEPQQIRQPQNLLYLNPRNWDDGDHRPTSYWCYKITGKNLWLATVGCVADWHVPDFISEFRKEYPELAPEQYTTVEELYLNAPIGQVIRVIQFNLKGQATDAKKSVLTLTRIESPYEILKQSTSRGKFLWKKYEKLASHYNKVLEEAQQAEQPSLKMFVYIYTDDSMTFTSELSNEMLIRYPERITLIGRHHDGAYKCSLRSRDMPLPGILAAALKGVDGYGGGHKNAVGCYVNEKDWDRFFVRLKEQIEAKGNNN